MSMDQNILLNITADASGLDEGAAAASASLDDVGGTAEGVAATMEAFGAQMEAVFAGLAQTMGDFAAAVSTAMGSLGDLSASADAAGGALDTASASAGQTAAAFDALDASALAAGDSLAASATATDAASVAEDANTVSTDANTASTDAGSAAHDKFAASAKSMVMPLGIAAAAIAAIGVISVHMAGDFQAGLTTLVTGAGESQKNLSMISQGILQTSIDTGESTKQLISGMFLIESAGHHGKDALVALQAAAEGAAVGASDLATVADGETTIMTDFANQHVTAAQAVNLMVAAVSNGKAHMSDLSASLSTILPTASSAGIGLTDVMGAMATMTSEAVKPAQAATFLRQTILALMAPSAQTTKALSAVGLTTSQVADEMQHSLPGALAMIQDAVEKKFPVGSAAYIAAMKNIAGGSKQMQGILDLTGTHLAAFQQTVGNVAGAVNKGGSSVQGWSLVQKDFNQQLSEGTAALQASMIKLGQALEPVATALVAHLTPALKALGSWITTHGQQAATIFEIVAGVIGGALVTALGAAAVAFLSVDAAALPFIALGAAIAGLAVGMVLLYNHSAPLRAIIADIGKGMQTLWSILKPLGAELMSQIAPVFAHLGDTLKSELLPAWQSLSSAFIIAKPLLEMIGAVIGGVIVVAIGILIGAVGGLVLGLSHFIAGIAQFFGGLVQAVSGVVKLIVDMWSGFFTILHDLFTGNWSKLGSDTRNWLTQMWNDIKQIATGIWNMLQGIFQMGVGTVVGFVQGFVGGIVGWFTTLWDKLVGHSIVPDMINGIIAWFAQLPDRAVAEVKTLVGDLTSAFTNLAGLAETWGRDLIQNLINGIKGMAGEVGAAAKGIAQNIASFLHFSVPEQGPLASIEQWIPDMAGILTKGMQGQTAAIQTAAKGMAGAVGAGFSAGLTAGAAGAGGGLAGIGAGLASSAAPVASGGLMSGAGAGGGGFGVGGGAQAQIVALLAQLVQQGGRQGQLGAAPTPANLGSVTQNLGGVNISGVTDLNTLYQQLNTLAGQAIENGARGATAGLGL